MNKAKGVWHISLGAAYSTVTKTSGGEKSRYKTAESPNKRRRVSGSLDATAAQSAGVASWVALVAASWAERFSDVCDELVTAHEERQEAIDFVEFSIEQIGETLQEFKDGEIWNPLHQVTQ